MRLNNVHNLSFGNSNINILYFNDMHGSTVNLESFKTAVDKFHKSHETEANFVLSGGDIYIDKAKSNLAVTQTMNGLLDATAVGNHDIEGGRQFEQLLKLSKFKWLAANLNHVKKAEIRKYIAKSAIISRNGEQIGVIGIAPSNYHEIAFNNNDDVEIKDFEKTLLAVRAEVEDLEAQGINKIVLLAHTGEKSNLGKNYYNELAKIGGIDVIIGGHDHKLVDKLTYSNRCEPVRIVSTGHGNNYDFKGNLDLIGELNLEFDDFGVLIIDKTKNIFKETANFVKTKLNINSGCKKDFEVICSLKEPVICNNPMTAESKVADIIADSNLWYVNSKTKGSKAAFALLNSGTVRSDFKNTDVTQNDIELIVPFSTSTLIKTKLTKKQIFDTLEWGIKSTKFPKPSPGIIQVSGLKYSVKPDGTVHNVYITNEKGKEMMKLDYLPDNIEFYCVYDTFLATGVAGLSELKKDFSTEKDADCTEFFDVSRQVALSKYLKNFNGNDIYSYSFDRIVFE